MPGGHASWTTPGLTTPVALKAEIADVIPDTVSGRSGPEELDPPGNPPNVVLATSSARAGHGGGVDLLDSSKAMVADVFVGFLADFQELGYLIGDGSEMRILRAMRKQLYRGGDGL